MHVTEEQIKAQLDGKFVKFTGKYGEGAWPFEVRIVDRDYSPFVEAAKPQTSKWLQELQNRKWTVITDEQAALIRKLYTEGFSIAKTAAAIGRHYTTVKPIYDRVAAEIGPVKANYTRGRKFEWADESRQRLLELRSRGLSWREIGRQLGCTHDSASREHYALTGDRAMLASGRNGTPAHWTDDEDKRLLELRALGLSRIEIGRRMGRSHWSVGARVARLAGKAYERKFGGGLGAECRNAT